MMPKLAYKTKSQSETGTCEKLDPERLRRKQHGDQPCNTKTKLEFRSTEMHHVLSPRK
jgi:hypothetical protein